MNQFKDQTINIDSAPLMKAILQYEFGGPEVLRYEDTPIPELSPGEVRVRVHAAGINPPDWYMRDAGKALPPEWQPKVDFPLILGTDISGIIEAVAEDVTEFSVGDEVYSMVRFPSGMMGGSKGYAQYVTVPVSEVALKPSNINFLQAAGAPMSLLTAWQFLIDLGHNEPNALQPHQHQPVALNGRKVLINGAGGGVGNFAVQLAKWKGAYVIAVASGRHEALLKDLGADEFIDYTKTAAEDVVKDLDLVVDTVGGASTERFLRTIKRGGALFPVFPLGFTGADKAAEMGITVSTTQVRSSGAQLTAIAPLLNDGSIRVIIDSTFPLADARGAHERAATGNIQGKIVLTVSWQELCSHRNMLF
jgi:NADPH:quinone reductase-like Zn-dependent oxidoreductase